MKNIHILPTDKPSRLHFTDFEEELVFTPKSRQLDGVNIYITSDEEIKEGDYFLEKAGRQFPIKWDGKEKLNFHCKKIILTTDQDLIKDGVQAIDDNFLEWFVKNPSCEFVEVEHSYVAIKVGKPSPKVYKIIIPKEEPKQHLIDMMQKDEELGLYDIFNDEKRQGVKELIDKHRQPTMISDWLEQNRNPEIDLQVEKELEFLSEQRLEKYSERFDNDESEIGNPDTWGKRVKQFKKK